MKSAGGRQREITTSHYPVPVGDEIIGVGVVADDVTDRIRTDSFRSAVMSQVADGVYTVDCDGRLRACRLPRRDDPFPARRPARAVQGARRLRGRGEHLTDREEEVLACLREGLSNASVAERLGVTANTVHNHVQRILYKLNVHSKMEAVVLTSREGLTDQGSNR